MSSDISISIIIPLYNEEESLPKLIQWIYKVMNIREFRYELILVDDGSTDQSWRCIQSSWAKDNRRIKGIRFLKNCGKSAALQVGFDQAIGDVIITMDADLQDSPEEIPELYQMIAQEKYDMVSGWKKKTT